MMNVKFLAASVLLVHSGALLAYALQTRDDLEYGWRYAGWYLQLSNVKPTQDCIAPAASQPVSVLHILQLSST